jgi:transcriptional regulator GlxA family with amidase domain
MEKLITPLSAQSFAAQVQAREPKVRTIAALAYPGVEILDVAGPLEVFAFANMGLQREGIIKEPAYAFKVLADKPGPITSLSGVQIIADAAYRDHDDNIDTLLIPGGLLHDTPLSDKLLIAWIQAMALRVRRLASVCTGAFLLAESGLLDGRRATTHWNYCNQLARDYPSVTVEPDKIFIQDNFIFTSGGITSGIDLALAMVE